MILSQQNSSQGMILQSMALVLQEGWQALQLTLEALVTQTKKKQ
jgi:hypothetical protein